MKVLVTGAGGFIGRVAVRALAGAGCDVLAHVGPPGAKLAIPTEATSVMWFDVEDVVRFALAFRGCDVVVHLAGPAAVAPSFDEPQRYLREHVMGTRAVLAAAQKANVRRFVYVSSADVYGRSVAARLTEKEQPHPRSPYAVAKLAAEALVGVGARTGGPEAFILRPFSIYGPGQRATSILATIVAQAVSDGVVAVRDLSPVRDYCHVEDLARAIVLACCAPLEEIDVVNVGTGVGTSVAELIATVAAALQSTVTIRELGADRGDADIPRLIADPRHALHALGWAPTVCLAEGVAWLVRGRAA